MKQRAVPPATTGQHIMIVDDNVDAATMLEMLLQARGHRTAVRHNAESLWMVPDLASFDVFLLDIGLPGMDGVTLARSLRNDPALARKRIIAITGGGYTDFGTALQAGFDEYLHKPVTTDILISLLESPA
jgi:CheY-like chemotaxis protein